MERNRFGEIVALTRHMVLEDAVASVHVERAVRSVYSHIPRLPGLCRGPHNLSAIATTSSTKAFEIGPLVVVLIIRKNAQDNPVPGSVRRRKCLTWNANFAKMGFVQIFGLAGSDYRTDSEYEGPPRHRAAFFVSMWA